MVRSLILYVTAMKAKTLFITWNMCKLRLDAGINIVSVMQLHLSI